MKPHLMILLAAPRRRLETGDTEMSDYMTESEAWLWLAALIEGTDGEAMVYSNGMLLEGLCLAIGDLPTVSTETEASMINRIYAAMNIGLVVYLHTKRNWTDGVRVNWCLEFAEQAAKEGR